MGNGQFGVYLIGTPSSDNPRDFDRIIHRRSRFPYSSNSSVSFAPSDVVPYSFAGNRSQYLQNAVTRGVGGGQRYASETSYRSFTDFGGRYESNNNPFPFNIPYNANDCGCNSRSGSGFPMARNIGQAYNRLTLYRPPFNDNSCYKGNNGCNSTSSDLRNGNGNANGTLEEPRMAINHSDGCTVAVVEERFENNDNRLLPVGAMAPPICCDQYNSPTVAAQLSGTEGGRLIAKVCESDGMGKFPSINPSKGTQASPSSKISIGLRNGRNGEHVPNDLRDLPDGGGVKPFVDIPNWLSGGETGDDKNNLDDLAKYPPATNLKEKPSQAWNRRPGQKTSRAKGIQTDNTKDKVAPPSKPETKPGTKITTTLPDNSNGSAVNEAPKWPDDITSINTPPLTQQKDASTKKTNPPVQNPIPLNRAPTKYGPNDTTPLMVNRQTADQFKKSNKDFPNYINSKAALGSGYGQQRRHSDPLPTSTERKKRSKERIQRQSLPELKLSNLPLTPSVNLEKHLSLNKVKSIRKFSDEKPPPLPPKPLSKNPSWFDLGNDENASSKQANDNAGPSSNIKPTLKRTNSKSANFRTNNESTKKDSTGNLNAAAAADNRVGPNKPKNIRFAGIPPKTPRQNSSF